MMTDYLEREFEEQSKSIQSPHIIHEIKDIIIHQREPKIPKHKSNPSI